MKLRQNLISSVVGPPIHMDFVFTKNQMTGISEFDFILVLSNFDLVLYVWQE